jgi:prolyl-tRNA synthetase
LLIPESFFKREAEHAEGFAPELAWVENKDEGSEERVAIRPTSETIMYDSYAKWIRSWRDLPLRINQWCNVLRWEVKQTKLFLRTREFLWQEGHCVYGTEQECDKEAQMFLADYQKVCEDLLAVPVIPGTKTEKERFAGAKTTYTIEALMPDGKALQMGTSHNLGQNFAKVFNVEFLDKKKEKQFAWQNSWGFSTRLIGAVVMAHGDDKGLVIPPRLAANKIVIVPIFNDSNKDKVLKEARKLRDALAEFNPLFDDRENYSPGWKFNEWEMKGVPLRVEIGPKDIENKQVLIVRRDNGKKEEIKMNELNKKIGLVLEDIQNNLFNNAKKFMKENIVEVKNKQEFQKSIENKKMVYGFFCHTKECEEQIKADTVATSRCIPLNQKPEKGKCFYCGKDAKEKAYFARAY